MEKCAIYTRVSSQRQSKGKSIEVQKEQGISYCKKQNFQYEILDEGAASSKFEDLEKRPHMKNLLDKVEDGNFQYVYVIDFDRLSRNEIVTAIIKHTLRENDVKLIVGNTEYDLQDEDRDMVAGLLGQFAILENRKRAKKSVNSRRLMVEQGYIPGSRPAYGYKIVTEKGKKRFDLDEEKAKVVRQMADLVLEEKNLGEVAQILDKKGISPPARKSKCWQSYCVGQILKLSTITGKHKLTGERMAKGKVIECPSIITEEEQERIKIQLRRNMSIVESKRKHKHYFRYGKVKCKWCGKALVAQFTYYETKRGLKRSFRLFCRGRNKHYRSGVCCKMPIMAGDELSRVIWWETAALLQNPKLLVEEYKKQIIVEDAKAVNLISTDKDFEKMITTKKERISELLELYTLKRIPVKYLDEEVNKLDNDIEAISEKRKALKESLENVSSLQINLEKIGKFVNKLKAIHKLTKDAKIKLLDLLIKKILIDYDSESKRHVVTIIYNLPQDCEPGNFLPTSKSIDFNF